MIGLGGVNKIGGAGQRAIFDKAQKETMVTGDRPRRLGPKLSGEARLWVFMWGPLLGIGRSQRGRAWIGVCTVRGGEKLCQRG